LGVWVLIGVIFENLNRLSLFEVFENMLRVVGNLDRIGLIARVVRHLNRNKDLLNRIKPLLIGLKEFFEVGWG